MLAKPTELTDARTYAGGSGRGTAVGSVGAAFLIGTPSSALASDDASRPAYRASSGDHGSVSPAASATTLRPSTNVAPGSSVMRRWLMFQMPAV